MCTPVSANNYLVQSLTELHLTELATHKLRRTLVLEVGPLQEYAVVPSSGPMFLHRSVRRMSAPINRKKMHQGVNFRPCYRRVSSQDVPTRNECSVYYHRLPSNAMCLVAVPFTLRGQRGYGCQIINAPWGLNACFPG